MDNNGELTHYRGLVKYVGLHIVIVVSWPNSLLLGTNNGLVGLIVYMPGACAGGIFVATGLILWN